MKGSERRAQITDIELKRLAAEFAEKLEHDPYQPGVIHPAIYADDLQEIVEDLFWIRDFSDVTLKVKRNPDGVSIAVEVLDRSINK